MLAVDRFWVNRSDNRSLKMGKCITANAILIMTLRNDVLEGELDRSIFQDLSG